MGYIDAGYAVALSVLVGYGAVLWQRRRRLEALRDEAVARERR
ncbi:MAG TPA: hypothetical protein VMB72_12660 [Acidimicrobiales bacterium]|nr:hypothetical protein [Acidimicrobiales bacterium]